MSNINVPQEYQRVAVVGGTGDLGKFISEELLKNKDIKVRVLTRKSGNDNKKELKQKFISQGADIVEVDYNDINSISDAFNGIDVVISTLNNQDFVKTNKALIDAAKQAKVKLFIPSEFGAEVEGVENPLTKPKAEIRSYVEKSGLDYIYYNNGFFIEHLVSDFYSIDVKNHKAKVIGTGDVSLVVTSIVDVGKFVAQTYFLPQVKNSFVDIVGEQTTVNNILKQVSEISNKPFQIETISLEEAKKVIEDPSTEFLTLVSYLFRRDIEWGHVKLGGNSNHLVPGFKFLSVKEYVKQAFFSN